MPVGDWHGRVRGAGWASLPPLRLLELLPCGVGDCHGPHLSTLSPCLGLVSPVHSTGQGQGLLLTEVQNKAVLGPGSCSRSVLGLAWGPSSSLRIPLPRLDSCCTGQFGRGLEVFSGLQVEAPGLADARLAVQLPPWQPLSCDSNMVVCSFRPAPLLPMRLPQWRERSPCLRVPAEVPRLHLMARLGDMFIPDQSQCPGGAPSHRPAME